MRPQRRTSGSLFPPPERGRDRVGVKCQLVGVECKLVGVECKLVGLECKLVGVV
jgi:hypothetical protein